MQRVENGVRPALWARHAKKDLYFWKEKKAVEFTLELSVEKKNRIV